MAALTEALEACKLDGFALADCTRKQRDEDKLVLVAVHDTGLALQCASERLRDDEAIVSAAVATQGEALEHASERLRGDATIASIACMKAGWALRHCSAALQDDDRVVATAVIQDGSSLKFASVRLRSDAKFVGQHGGRAILEVADASCREDTQCCAACCAKDGEALQLCPEAIKKDRHVVLEAVKSCGAALRHVDDLKLLADAEVVLAAAATWGGALERCSPRLKQYPAFIRKAVAIDPWHLQHADGPGTWRDGSALQFAPHALRADGEVVTKAVTAPADGRADALSYADEELRGDATIVLAAAKASPAALQHAAPELLNDRKFAEAAIKSDWKCLAFVSAELRADKKLVEGALKQSADVLALTPLDADPKIALLAVKKDGLALCHVRPSGQTKDVVLAAVKQNVEALQFVADEALLRDKDIVAATKKHGVVLEGDDEDEE